jgi:hypothetical protein
MTGEPTIDLPSSLSGNGSSGGSGMTPELAAATERVDATATEFVAAMQEYVAAGGSAVDVMTMFQQAVSGQ